MWNTRENEWWTSIGNVYFSFCPLHRGQVAERLGHFATVPKTTVRDPPRAYGWTLAYCAPSSEWGPDGNIGRQRRRGKELATLLHKADGAGQVSSLTGPSPTYGSYMGAYLYPLPLCLLGT